VALADISTAWSGDYVLVWQVPPGVKEALSPGSRGQAITWLRKSLAAIAGDDRKADGPAAFDDELVKRVKAFQLAEGIIPDGVVGALTIARLDMRLDRTLPRLDPTAESSRNVLHP
jgi:general secretion pathway protein A